MSLTSAAAQSLDQTSNPPTIMVHQRRSSLSVSSQSFGAFDLNNNHGANGEVTSTSPPAFVSIRPLPSPTGLASFAPPPHHHQLASAIQQDPPQPPSRAVSVSSIDVPPPPMSSGSASICSDQGDDCHIPKSENTGRWSAQEHKVFLEGLELHGKAWKKIAVMIKTRSVVQVRTHAQKYFQKLSKSKKDGPVPSISTASSDSIKPAAIKRKPSVTPSSKSPATAKRRKVSVSSAVARPGTAAAVASNAMIASSGGIKVDHSVIDPQFMQTLNMSIGHHELDGDIDASILDLLDVSDENSVDAVEQVIAEDVEPTDEMEPTPVTPSVSYMSLDNVSLSTQEQEPRQDMVVSPKPEDFSIHNKIGTSGDLSGPELSPTSVTNMMEFKDLGQVKMGTAAPSGIYVDALDWLMDVGVDMLPTSAAEREEEWPASSSPKLTSTQVAQVTSNALSVLDGTEDVF